MYRYDDHRVGAGEGMHPDYRQSLACPGPAFTGGGGAPTMIVWVTLGVVEIVGVGEGPGTGEPEAVGDKDAV